MVEVPTLGHDDGGAGHAEHGALSGHLMSRSRSQSTVRNSKNGNTHVGSSEQDHLLRSATEVDVVGDEVGRRAAKRARSALSGGTVRGVDAPEHAGMPQLLKLDDRRVALDDFGAHGGLAERSGTLREAQEAVELGDDLDRVEPDRVVRVELAVDLRGRHVN